MFHREFSKKPKLFLIGIFVRTFQSRRCFYNLLPSPVCPIIYRPGVFEEICARNIKLWQKRGCIAVVFRNFILELSSS